MFNHLEEVSMLKKHLLTAVLSLGALIAVPARAQTEASAVSALSALPLASVAAGAGAGASLAVPAILSAAGAVFVVKSVDAGALSTMFVLERASDGVQISLEIGRASAKASPAVGDVVSASATGAGVILSVGYEVVAFVPNALGRSLLHNERLTH